MVDRNLIREFQVDDNELEQQFGEALNEIGGEDAEMDLMYDETSRSFDANQIVKGVVLRVNDGEVLVDIGYKSEGTIPVEEWPEEEPVPSVGETVEVLLEEIEDDFGLLLLSKRKADRARDWEAVTSQHDEGDVVTGKVIRKIKGGLLVNIGENANESGSRGVNVFLPASQVDIRRPSDIGEYVGKEIECVILKIDESRKNIVVSRRKLIEDQRAELKRKLLEELEEGQLRSGLVKNIADFGAFVDLGGIDGLLHITDMSYSRIGHPSEMVKIDDEIEIVILNVDREKEKVALGLKQKYPSPWENIETKYPVGSRIKGEVVNVMSYGAFVKLEDGIEGLVHISEMSWTKRISHPNELVHIGDEVEVVVLGINTDKQEISLGMKQTQPNPWDDVATKYPEGTRVKGVVRNLTNYGAFIELEEGVDGLLHVSDMSWTRKISHANEMLKKGDEIECIVLNVDDDRKRIALGLKQLDEDPWDSRIPDNYQPGSVVKGTVTKITNFGVFVELEQELEGLLHISELASHKVANPEDEVQIGEEIEVRILRIDQDDRKIGLSRRLEATDEEIAEAAAGTGTSTREELKGGMGEGSGPLFSMESVKQTEEAESEAESGGEPTGEEKPAQEAESDSSGDDEMDAEESQEKPETEA
ncbi:MAG: 30S ribosomal protein S1 [Planctomycetota bacterium]|nr:MAG: 30S ribosomal protein S1 [Planctomycetota bacterium]REJ90389.1 MAG: 30S ribosomal protein S1 [Planctomycetota bacterium]REK28874.1 MAG: 30S ribosomal protein S1 [Planctomycetota bacterium]REK39692.1 MAG: 30S ribosomal protein S1 [Planctomycetota bacterium]